MGSFKSSLIGVSAITAIGFAQPVLANRLQGGTNVIPCGDGEVKYTPIQLWPPNHKMQDIQIEYIDSSEPNASQGDKDGDPESLTVNSITSSQSGSEERNGERCGPPTNKQGPDFTFSSGTVSGTDPTPIGTTVQVRAERCGAVKLDRTYDINVSCGDNDVGKNPTTVDLTVTVPHDRRHAHKVSTD